MIGQAASPGARSAEDAEFFLGIVQGESRPSPGSSMTEAEVMTYAADRWQAECVAASAGAENYCADALRTPPPAAAAEPLAPPPPSVPPLAPPATLVSRLSFLAPPLHQAHVLFWRARKLIVLHPVTLGAAVCIGLVTSWLAHSSALDIVAFASEIGPSFALGSAFVAFAAAFQLYEVERESCMLARERDSGASPLLLFLSKLAAGVELAAVLQTLFLVAFDVHFKM
jgi:hypothetical protein